jgi:DNA-binding beta-propeller fold protein YncE
VRGIGFIGLVLACSPDAFPLDPESPIVRVNTWGGYGTAPGQFVEPSSVELDSAGFVYVAGHEDRVQKFTRDGELVNIWGTHGTGDGQFNHPHGLAIDRARGDLIYVGDQENGRMQVFTPDGAFVRLWTDLQFQHIHDVGIDPTSGDVFIGDYELDVLQRFTSTGDPVVVLGGTGNQPGKFNGIWGVSTDSAGNIYVADSFNRRIQKLSPAGEFITQWSDYAGTRFQKPTGVFVDARDVIYVCDSLAESVLLFDGDGAFLEQWHMRDVLGETSEPEDIVLDPTGEHIYVVEVRSHRVHYLNPRVR